MSSGWENFPEPKPRIKGKVAEAFTVIGTDGSFIDGIEWWPDEIFAKWDGTEGVTIVRVKVKVLCKAKRPQHSRRPGK